MNKKYLYVFKFKDVNIIKIGLSFDFNKRKNELEFLVGRNIDMRESLIISSEYDDELNIFEKQLLIDYRGFKPKSDAEFMKNKLYAPGKTEFRYADCMYEIVNDLIRKKNNPYLHFRVIHVDNEFIAELQEKYETEDEEEVK